MSADRLPLFHFDVMRELCDDCRRERFHFVPTGAAAAPGHCPACGARRRLADVSDTSIIRLVTQPNGEVVIVRDVPPVQ